MDYGFGFTHSRAEEVEKVVGITVMKRECDLRRSFAVGKPDR